MGFKWFKARIRMNRMPLHSSAVAGSYKTTTFDSPTNEYISNDDQKDNGHVKSEPELSTRPISMPDLNNPIVGISNGEDNIEFVQSRNDTARSLSTRSLEESDYEEENMYGGLGLGEPISFVEKKFKNNFDDNIGVRRPTPAPKMRMAHKKKKAKAPMPTSNLNTINASESEYGTTDFLSLKNNRKVSQDSDFEV